MKEEDRFAGCKLQFNKPDLKKAWPTKLFSVLHPSSLPKAFEQILIDFEGHREGAL